MGSRLDLVTSPPNIGAAMGMLIFALGWNGFTTFHATLMIGGMYKAFGVAAFALLLFYAIFFSVGFAIFWGAFLAGAEESIELEGDQLTIKRKLLRFTHRKKHTLDLDTFARIGMAERTQLRNSERGPNLAKAIILTDDNGRPINLGSRPLMHVEMSTARRSISISKLKKPPAQIQFRTKSSTFLILSK
ncbi:MAG: hypothetical protein R2688_07000 [Fimbriimonadaceae bacterium]